MGKTRENIRITGQNVYVVVKYETRNNRNERGKNAMKSRDIKL